MRILVAGGTGVLGSRISDSLVAVGHQVTATSRHPEHVVPQQGIELRAMDAFDADQVRQVVADSAPDVIVHQLTDLGGKDSGANADIRRVGTRNLIDAAHAAGVESIIAQSISWAYEGTGRPAVESDPLDLSAHGPRAVTVGGVHALESAVRELPHHVILRYGTLYGPRTWYARDGDIAAQAHAGRLVPANALTCFVHVDDAVAAAVAALGWPSGAVNVADDDPAADTEWIPAFCRAVGAPVPEEIRFETPPTGSALETAKASSLGWSPVHSSWRESLGRS
ncbi:NAD-dependent epimerase/dehydratase family protein [Antrihabitans cavernicola]|uniref:NAD(P)-dependent oxidoreductase n=1 Tax=Antrihabitans cavernicola TaxID=2495913 RepID=A0A5A7SLH5_9NOCA|nr:NAD(P)-dependent oxidoreductase [Spelaeibacter cavernicola]KAA0025091.1 NAD(P)-dependent oxidoreductase [Spelaeibacter cavernicola]